MIDALRENGVRSDECIGEVHTSLFDLAQQQLLLQSNTGNAEIIDLSNTAQSPLNLFLADDLSYVDLLYDLTGPEFDPLGRLSGDRELIFSIGGEEALATIEPGGSIRFNNPANINLFEVEDFLTIQFYQANDTANILWEYAFGGIEITTSKDADSNKAQSFIICDAVAQQQNICTAQQPITAKLLLPVQETDSVQWRVEALEGSDKTDDMPKESKGGSGSGNKPFTYGKTKNWRTGGLSASGIAPTEFGNGRYQNAWVSQPQFGTEAVYFSFVPDMKDATGEKKEFKVEHLPAVYQRKKIGNVNNPLYICSGQYDDCINGTNMSDVWRHNPHVGYKISVIINGEHTITKTVKMDEIDVLRQEYINHNVSASTTIPVPPRKKVVKLPPGNWVEISSPPADTDYPYSVVLNEGMVDLGNEAIAIFNAHRNDVFTLADGSTVTMPTTARFEVTSSYRNPERQERLGSVTSSRHLQGRAVDFSLKSVPDADKEIAYYILWQIFTTYPPASADRFAIELGPNENIRVATVSNGSVSDINGGVWSNADILPTIGGNSIEDIYRNTNHVHFQNNK